MEEESVSLGIYFTTAGTLELPAPSSLPCTSPLPSIEGESKVECRRLFMTHLELPQIIYTCKSKKDVRCSFPSFGYNSCNHRFLTTFVSWYKCPHPQSSLLPNGLISSKVIQMHHLQFTLQRRVNMQTFSTPVHCKTLCWPLTNVHDNEKERKDGQVNARSVLPVQYDQCDRECFKGQCFKVWRTLSVQPWHSLTLSLHFLLMWSLLRAEHKDTNNYKSSLVIVLLTCCVACCSFPKCCQRLL